MLVDPIVRALVVAGASARYPVGDAAGARRRRIAAPGLKEKDDEVPGEDAAAEGDDDVQEELGEEAAEASDTESHAYL